ncbi:heme d1 biosynthesis radical SAM protein NirJ2 [Clostridium drakei]|uniref:Heme d1 biosynthesis radical SAM protein NirJ2 n=2 Tax=Clostridium drakei TaxID=332101 RepID=A0A2U8DN40_9CLOT|nr:heme d1 biosynthesis radical SAM protein NirJ2 [Clostridium drakei]
MMIVSWNTTNKCNMYCSHCYRDSGKEYKEELTTEQGKKLIEQIAKAGFRMMIFSGGEPLMRNDIFQLIQYASDLGLIPVLGSNGTLITLEIAEKLKKSGARSVGISLDSLDEEKHNKFRSHENAWKNTVQGMKNCKEAGLKFQVHTTVMKWNKEEILDITDFTVKIGASAHHIFFLVPTGRGNEIEEQALDNKEYKIMLENIMKKQQEVNIELKPTCAPQFVKIAESLGVKTRFKRGCLAGISYCIVSPKGNVQPCAYLMETAGNVKEKAFNDIWNESNIFKNLRSLDYKGSCGQCSYKESCGGCRARAAHYNNGDYMSGENSCILSKS